MSRLRALLAGLVCRARGHRWLVTGGSFRGGLTRCCERCYRWTWD